MTIFFKRNKLILWECYIRAIDILFDYFLYWRGFRRNLSFSWVCPTCSEIFLDTIHKRSHSCLESKSITISKANTQPSLGTGKSHIELTCIFLSVNFSLFHFFICIAIRCSKYLIDDIVRICAVIGFQDDNIIEFQSFTFIDSHNEDPIVD